jgi:hypothetical protein
MSPSQDDKKKRSGMSVSVTKEAKYIECWPTQLLLGLAGEDLIFQWIGLIHSLLRCTSSTLGSPTCH